MVVNDSFTDRYTSASCSSLITLRHNEYDNHIYDIHNIEITFYSNAVIY